MHQETNIIPSELGRGSTIIAPVANLGFMTMHQETTIISSELRRGSKIITPVKTGASSNIIQQP